MDNRYRLKGLLIGVAAVLLCCQQGLAEELIGVPVYPGAKLDPVMTDHLEDVLAEDGAAYTTADAPAQVAEVYRAEGFAAEGEGKKGHLRLGKDDILVTIQGPPRKDPASGDTRQDTLITILRVD